MRVALVFVLLAACSKSNPYYCPGNPDDNCTNDADVNAPQGCQTNDDCTNSAKPLCEPSAKICVACLAGGSCEMDIEVADVTAAGARNACTKARSRLLLEDALAKNAPYVKSA